MALGAIRRAAPRLGPLERLLSDNSRAKRCNVPILSYLFSLLQYDMCADANQIV